jgi:hypothetical protein
MIICAGGRSDTFYYIIRGSVSIMTKDDDGRKVALISLPAAISSGAVPVQI